MGRPAAALAAVVTLFATAACTSSAAPPDPSTSTIVTTITRTSTPAPPVSDGPITSGPVIARDADSCPYLSLTTAADRVGMRLERITVLSSGGKSVGCRIYALQHPNDQCSQTCLDAEDLPPANQPAIEITSQRYPDADAAHNAFVRLVGDNPTVQQAEIAKGNVGLCFQTAFYAKDNGKDWACTFNVGATMVVIKTAATDQAQKAIGVSTAVASKF